MTTQELLDQFEQLSVAERIQLVQDMWDRIAAKPEELPALSEGQREELQRRLASYTANPEQTLPAEEVFAALQQPSSNPTPSASRRVHARGRG